MTAAVSSTSFERSGPGSRTTARPTVVRNRPASGVLGALPVARDDGEGQGTGRRQRSSPPTKVRAQQGALASKRRRRPQGLVKRSPHIHNNKRGGSHQEDMRRSRRSSSCSPSSRAKRCTGPWREWKSRPMVGHNLVVIKGWHGVQVSAQSKKAPGGEEDTARSHADARDPTPPTSQAMPTEAAAAVPRCGSTSKAAACTVGSRRGVRFPKSAAYKQTATRRTIVRL